MHPNNKVEVVKQIEYSDEAKSYITFRRQRMIAARDIRDGSRQEYDDMNFLTWYDTLKKADDQYVAPRKNKADTSINLGTIRDKDSTLLEVAMKNDYENIAQVYDDSDDALVDLAEVGEDLVRKSKEMEMYRQKARLIYRSMIAFGTALVEDAFVERWVKEKTLAKGAKIGSASAEWTEKLVKQYDGCQAKLWDLRKCYFGDIRKFFMNGPQGQPYFFTVEYESYDVAKQWFGDWERWEYVPTYVVVTPEISTAAQYMPAWTLRPISQNYVEIVRYYDPVSNEYAITLNGVDMLPIMEKKVVIEGIEKTLISGFPLTEVSPSGAINFAKFDNEPMHDFTYSKPQPAKMRVVADIENMVAKLMLGAFKQSVKPTMGNKSGRIFGPEVTDAGETINDIREGDLFPVLPNWQGVTAGMTSYYELIKKELDKNSVDRQFQGMNEGTAPATATQDMNNQKDQMLKVASMIDGICNGEAQLAWLRTYNIMKNWTKPIDQRVDELNKAIVQRYRTVTIPTEVEGGMKATKRIVFTKDTTMSSDDVHEEELKMSKDKGSEHRIAYLHPDQFASLKANWYYKTIPVPNDADPLSYMVFAKQILDAQQFFGPESLNVKRLKHQFAKKTGQDFDNWFLNEQELQANQEQAAAAAQAEAAQGQNPPSKPTPKGINPPGGTPTIGKMAMGAQPQIGQVMK